MNVNGRVSATAIGVVIPGTAPTKVPMVTPSPNSIRFCQVAKRWNPSRIVSIIAQRPANNGARIPAGIGTFAIL